MLQHLNLTNFFIKCSLSKHIKEDNDQVTFANALSKLRGSQLLSLAVAIIDELHDQCSFPSHSHPL
nr:MAG TPA: hypothetical protein [Caudoviricetes sp.]